MKSKLLLLFLSLTFSVTKAQTTYKLVSGPGDLVSGGKYLIVNSKTVGSAEALSKQASSNNNRETTTVTISPTLEINTTPASLPTDTKVFELLLGTQNGNWTFFDAVNNGFLYAASSSNNLLKFRLPNNDANGEWKITFSNGAALIEAQGTNIRNKLRYNLNGGNPIFSCYETGQQDVYLFVETSTQPSAPDISNQTFSGFVGNSFSETPVNNGGGANNWSVVSGALPTGLLLNSATGEISGTPATAGTYQADIKATNGTGSDTATYTFNITDACFYNNFSDITNGDNTTTTGSGTIWNGNSDFPNVDKAYQADGAVKIGTGSVNGYIESKILNGVSGDLIVRISVKGWTTVEGDLIVSIDGQNKTVSYSAKMADLFEDIMVQFINVTAGSRLKIQTTAKRAFINSVEVNCNADISYPTDYFRSLISGNWTTPPNWESSHNGISDWKTATLFPDQSATKVTVQINNQMKLNKAGIVIKNTEVFGSLEVNDNNFSVNGALNGKELYIKNGGKFIINGKGIKSSGNAFGLVETGGILEIQNFEDSPDVVTAYMDANPFANSLFSFQNAAVFNWNSTMILPSTTHSSIFKMVSSGNLVTFRLLKNFTNFGNNSNDNSFNAVLECTGNKTMILTGNNNKVFIGGVQGTGIMNINYPTGTGNLSFGSATGTATLGSTGNLKLVVSSGKVKLKSISVPSTAYVTINSNDLNNPNVIERSSGNLTINGTLDITDLRVNNSDNTGGVIVNNTGILRTKYLGSGGLYGSNSAIPSGVLTLNDGNTIEYYGGNQTISNLSYFHLKLSGNGTKTPVSATTVHTNGSVSIEGTTTVDFSNNNLADTGSNNTGFNMTGGRLILGTTGTQPNMQGIYNLNGGVVEFSNGNITRENIRSGNNHNYFGVEVSGSNVGNSNTNINLNPGGSFKVLGSGVFEINQRSIKCVTANQCSVTVKNGGLFKTGNSKGFNGYTPIGLGFDDSAIHENVSNITLENNSTVEYIRNSPQLVSVFTPGYQKLKISDIGPFIEKDTSGNGVEIKVNQTTDVTSSGKLIVKETDDDKLSNVLSALGGITVQNGGELTFENNAQLMQNSSAVNSGNINVKRKFNFTDARKEYNFVISPIVGQNLKTIYGSPNSPYALRYEESDDYFYSSDGSYIEARALAVKEQPGSGVASIPAVFTGGIFNGNSDAFVLKRQSNATNGFNLTGNPYPSNLNLIDLYNGNSNNIYPTFYFWDNRSNGEYEQQGNTYNGDQYAKFNALNETGVNATSKAPNSPGGAETRIPNGFAKVGTGFLIQTKEGKDGEKLHFENDYRKTDNGPGFFGKTTATVKDRYWLTLDTPGGMQAMSAVVYYDGGNNDFWLDDTESFESSDDIFTMVDDKKISIQGKSVFNPDDQLALGYKAFKAGPHYISVYKKEGVFENGTNIFLIDNKLNKVINLSRRSYKFNTKRGEFTDRFTIVYQRPILNRFANDNIQPDIEILRIDGQIVVKSEKNKIIQFQVYGLNGQPLFAKSGINDTEFKTDVQNLESQVFIVRVQTENGEWFSKKFLK